MDVSILGLLLILAMLAITALRVYAPFPARIEGQQVLEVRVGLLFRALRQRTNVLAILVVLVLGSGTFGARWISPSLFAFTLLAVAALLVVPLRYRFTTKGVSPDPASFRSWSDFTTWTASGNVVELKGERRLGTLRLYVSESDRAAVRSVLTRILGAR